MSCNVELYTSCNVACLERPPPHSPQPPSVHTTTSDLMCVQDSRFFKAREEHHVHYC